MKRTFLIIISIVMVVSVVSICENKQVNASAYYDIAKKAGAEGRITKIGKYYFYYENRMGCGKNYRYYKVYTNPKIIPGEYLGKHSWTNGKKLFYVIKNRIIRMKLSSFKDTSKKLGSKKYKYKIKKIRKNVIYITKSRKNKVKTIKYYIKTRRIK